MSMRYVRRVYGVPAKRGMRVESIPDTPQCPTRTGVITRATAYVYVRFDDEKRPVPYHPCSLRYIGAGGAVLWPLPEEGVL
jgi:hypothetical protein